MAEGDEYIDQRLRAWGDWNVRRESGGLGYPREAPYTRMAARSGTGGFTPPELDGEAMEIERAVAELPDYLRDTVREVYVEPGTVDQKIKRLRCGKQTLYDRIRVAQGRIKNWLDNARKKKRLTVPD